MNNELTAILQVVTQMQTELRSISDKLLQLLEKPRTERCQACDRTYPDSEIVRHGSEQLCLSCDSDKYPIRDEDIPF